MLETIVPRQNLKLGLCVIPAQAGIQTGALDSRLRGNDEPQTSKLTPHQLNNILSPFVISKVALSSYVPLISHFHPVSSQPAEHPE